MQFVVFKIKELRPSCKNSGTSSNMDS